MDRKEKRGESETGTNSTDCLLWLCSALCDMFYVFTFIQLLIKSFLCEDVFAILGTTQSFPFNNNTVCCGPRHMTFKKKKKGKSFS